MKNTPQPSRKKATVLQATGAYINTGITVIQGLLLIPLYLHYIDISLYGLWLASGGVVGMLGLVNLGIGNLMIQKIAKAYGKQDFYHAAAYFSNGIVVYICLSAFVAALGLVISIWVPDLLKINSNHAALIRECFQIAVIALAIGILNECLGGFGQAMLKPLVPMAGRIFGRIAGLCITVLLLLQGTGLWALPIGLLITEGIIFLFNTFNVINLFKHLEMQASFNRKIIMEYIKTSPALMMATAGNAITNSVEPILITMFLNPHITAIYMVNRKIADIISSLLNVFVGATAGSFSHLVGSSNKDHVTNIMKSLLILSFSIGVIGYATYVATSQAFVSLWVGEDFVIDQFTILFIALAAFSRAIRGLIGQLLFGLGDYIYTSKLVFYDSVIKTLLATLLINMVGLIAVPFTFALVSLVAILLLGIRMQKKWLIRFNIQKIAKFIMVGLLMFVVSMLISHVKLNISSWTHFSTILIMTALAISLIYALINIDDLKEIHQKHFQRK